LQVVGIGMIHGSQTGASDHALRAHGSGPPLGQCCRARPGACRVWMIDVSSNGIFWVLRAGAPWRDLPGCYGPYTTCYNRFVRWRRAGVWGRLMATLTAAHDKAILMIDTSIVRVHQHAACVARNRCQSMGRSRGGLTSKIHAVVDTNGLPVVWDLQRGKRMTTASSSNSWLA
jgi:transposase